MGGANVMVAGIALITGALLAPIMVNPDLLRLGLFVPVGLAALAVLIGAPRGLRLRLGMIIVALALGVWAANPLIAGFGLLFAVMLGAFCPQALPLALSAVPVIALMWVWQAVTPGQGWHPVQIAEICLALGAILAPIGALLAVCASDFTGLALGFVLGLSGIALGGAGLGSAPVMLMAAAASSLAGAGLALIGQRLDAAAGQVALDWLGGLARGMPDLSFVLLALLLGVSALPPGPAFDVLVLIVRALGTAPSPRAGWFGLGAAFWAGLSMLAALRGFALVALGRPRSLRAAAAEDVRDGRFVAMAGLAVAMLLLGLLAAPDRLVVIGVTCSVAVMVAMLVGILAPRRVVPVEHWTEGFAKPPLWLPFDDPTTQMTATGFAAITLGAGAALPAWLRAQSAGARHWLAMVLAP